MCSDSIFGCLFFTIESHVHREFWANLGYIVRLCLQRKNQVLRVGETAQRVKALVAKPDGPVHSLGLTVWKEKTHSPNCLLICALCHATGPLTPPQ